MDERLHPLQRARLALVILPMLGLVLASCTPQTPPQGPVGPPIPTCFDYDDTINPAGFDIEYVGPENAVGNLEFKSTFNQSCGDPTNFTGTAVVALDLAAAIAICQGIGAGNNANSSEGAPILPNPGPYFWLCVP